MPRVVEPLSVALEDVCFLHWPVDRAAVATVVPDWLSVDVADGDAWVSAVALTMARWEVAGVAVREDVAAVNVRTYVRTPDDQRAVYFCSVDATDRIAVDTARRLFRLPYYHADVTVRGTGERTRIEASRRKRKRRRAGRTGVETDDDALIVECEPQGTPETTGSDTLASFLTDRYRYATTGPLGSRLVGSVGHDRWRLQPADVVVDRATLLAAAGIDDVAGDPIAHYSPGSEFRVGLPRPVTP